MTADAPLQGAGLGRSAPSASPLPPIGTVGGRPLDPRRASPPKCAIFSCQMRSFRLPLTGMANGKSSRRPEGSGSASIAAPFGFGRD